MCMLTCWHVDCHAHASADTPVLRLRSLGLLAPHLEDAQLRDMLQKLCEKCTTSSKKEEHRDIAVIGLKTTAQAVTDSQADVLIDIVMPTLVASVAAKVSLDAPGIISNKLTRRYRPFQSRP